jgi:hypothetical protein
MRKQHLPLSIEPAAQGVKLSSVLMTIRIYSSPVGCCTPRQASDYKKKTRRGKFRIKLFCSSTDREAKELFFLERFTCFQQGGYGGSATLATRRHFAVELLQKSKQHFA